MLRCEPPKGYKCTSGSGELHITTTEEMRTVTQQEIFKPQISAPEVFKLCMEGPAWYAFSTHFGEKRAA